MKNVLIDSNIMYVLYGSCNFDRSLPYKQLNKFQLIIKLAEEGRVRIFMTPQLLKEFKTVEGKYPDKIAKFENFLRNYITLVTFNEKQNIELMNILKTITNERFPIYDAHNSKNFDTLLFPRAENIKAKNYADAKIMAEATMLNLPIITENLKDFTGWKNINLALKKYCKNYSKCVLNLRTYLKEYFPKEFNLYSEIPNYKAKKHFKNYGKEMSS